jgi:hypothetical protein
MDSVRKGAETTSRHFVEAPAAQSRAPYEPLDVMADCDEFERVTTEECYQKLIRLRNDVRYLALIY